MIHFSKLTNMAAFGGQISCTLGIRRQTEFIWNDKNQNDKDLLQELFGMAYLKLRITCAWLANTAASGGQISCPLVIGR